MEKAQLFHTEDVNIGQVTELEIHQRVLKLEDKTLMRKILLITKGK